LALASLLSLEGFEGLSEWTWFHGQLPRGHDHGSQTDPLFSASVTLGGWVESGATPRNNVDFSFL